MHQLKLVPLILTYFLLLPASYRRGSFFLGPHFLVCCLRCCRTKVTTRVLHTRRRRRQQLHPPLRRLSFLPPPPFQKWQQFLLMPLRPTPQMEEKRTEGGREILRTPAFSSFPLFPPEFNIIITPRRTHKRERKLAYDLTRFSLCVTSKKNVAVAAASCSG